MYENLQIVKKQVILKEKFVKKNLKKPQKLIYQQNWTEWAKDQNA